MVNVFDNMIKNLENKNWIKTISQNMNSVETDDSEFSVAYSKYQQHAANRQKVL